jgi:hypothetical protein
MPRKSLLIAAAILASQYLGSQSLAAYLPTSAASSAAKLLARAAAADASLESSLKAAWSGQAQADAACIQAYALAAASRSSKEAWASPDGGSLSAGAAAAFAAARDRAKADARAIASGGSAGDSAAGLAEAGAAARDSLALLILKSGIGEKAALGLERYLADFSKDLGRLFPEAIEVESLLRKAGAGGAREAAAAMSRRRPQEVAEALVSAKERLAALSASTAEPLSRLEAVLTAYRAWIAASAIAAYPGDLPAAKAEERSALGNGIAALSLLGTARSAALLSAMASGDTRSQAAAEAARRLAAAWSRSPQSRRLELAALSGAASSSMAAFAAAAASLTALRSSAAGVQPTGVSPVRDSASQPAVRADPLSVLAGLDALEIAIADEQTQGGAARGAEPCLSLLERPELAAAAKSEPRYSNLFAEASARLLALYSRAAQDAQARLESSQAVFKSASRALGTVPTGLVVRSVDLAAEAGRRLAFVASAEDSSGASVWFPIRSDLAGSEYALAFARAAGLQAAEASLKAGAAGTASFLAAYGQSIAAAYDPENWGDALALDSFPALGSAGKILEGTTLELAILEGWRP